MSADEPTDGFRPELERLLNRHSKENGSDTPDFILAEYIADCLCAFDHAVEQRERWYGRIAKRSDSAPGFVNTDHPAVRAKAANDGD